MRPADRQRPALPRCDTPEIQARLAAAARGPGSARRLDLFLDYDGTLADFAPTPENPAPDERVVRLLSALVAAPHIRVAVISGRRLDHLEVLLPVPGLLLAGTYGMELRDEDGRLTTRAPFEQVRPRLEALKPAWARLLDGRAGFFLEDKGWSLALHARFADDAEAEAVLREARALAEPAVAQQEVKADLRVHPDPRVRPDQRFHPVGLQLLGGHKFLEIAPVLADKGRVVEDLLSRPPSASERQAPPGAGGRGGPAYPPEALRPMPIYVGDDDKDEKAFAVIRRWDGLAVLVARRPRATLACCRLPSPAAARAWLAQLAAV